MPQFTHDGVEIAFFDQGEGEPIVLVHGFASNKEVNWVMPGWVATLTGAGRRVIALDNRGHGASAKLYDPPAYHSSIMAEDVRALIDHLGLPRADVMGYSMGARISAFLALAHPDRVRSVVLGGLGMGLINGVGDPERIAAGLEAPSLADVADPGARQFRSFAEQTRSDLRRFGGVHARLAPDPEPGGGGPDRHAAVGCGWQQGHDRRAAGRTGRPRAECAGADHSQPRSHVGGRR